MKVVIMAGGKGTRISSIRDDIPKPMIELNQKPVLQYQIENLRENGYNEIILVVGYLAHKIEDYFRDGKLFGVNIEYFHEKSPLGTAGALKKIKEKLTEDFLLINGDIIFNLDLDRFVCFHREKKATASIVTHPNSHPYDSSLILKDCYDRVTKWLVKEEDRKNIFGNRVNAGIHILSPKIFSLLDGIEKEKIDLDRDVLKILVKKRELYAFDSPEYIHDMGTPDRYERVCNDLKNDIPCKKNLKNKQKAIFLDRDGTINIYKGFLRRKEDMELIPGVTEAIRKINQSEYLVIVITNQPVIARGECSYEELDKIHDKMKYLLGCEGAYIDDLFYCPHHPDKGFEGEIQELKVKCNCRKPNNGLLLEAAEKYNIDLSKSYMVGDSLNDVQAGVKSGCKSYLLGESKGDFTTFPSLKICIEKILE